MEIPIPFLFRLQEHFKESPGDRRRVPHAKSLDEVGDESYACARVLHGRLPLRELQVCEVIYDVLQEIRYGSLVQVSPHDREHLQRERAGEVIFRANQVRHVVESTLFQEPLLRLFFGQGNEVPHGEAHFADATVITDPL